MNSFLANTKPTIITDNNISACYTNVIEFQLQLITCDYE